MTTAGSASKILSQVGVFVGSPTKIFGCGENLGVSGTDMTFLYFTESLNILTL